MMIIANVTFEPKCRNNWHIHKASKNGGQILICVDGEGWYQEEGKKPQSLKIGDVVTIPANVKHWHGAKKDKWFSHLAIEVPGENTSNEWCEKVTNEEYDKLWKNQEEILSTIYNIAIGYIDTIFWWLIYAFLSNQPKGSSYDVPELDASFNMMLGIILLILYICVLIPINIFMKKKSNTSMKRYVIINGIATAFGVVMYWIIRYI
mgnify:CR=1 FL=1